MMALAALLAVGAALAGVLDTSVHTTLASASGWTVERTDDRVQISRKTMPDTGLIAWQGSTVLDPGLTAEQFLDVLTDTRFHATMSEDMVASVPVRSEQGATLYYQVLDLPTPLSDRYWVAYARTTPDHPVAGTYFRQWSTAAPDRAKDVRSDLSARYPRAVEVTHTHGQWVVEPQPDGSLKVTIRSVIDPAGNIPARLAGGISGRGMAENIRRMERAARARHGP